MSFFLPVEAIVEGVAEFVSEPQQLPAGFGATGPLARSLFLMGWIEEQTLIARLKGKGVAIITGCGHPTIELIVKMVKSLCHEPIYAIVGGLHFPVTGSPLKKSGIQSTDDLGHGEAALAADNRCGFDRTVSFLRKVVPQKLLLSAHDSCDHALSRISDELQCDTRILKAGETYDLQGG
ncbi:hypothetical protein [Desulfosediminicola ganghwensis]|uniref:hypothetical protein n=1 Tax=Desulfosediminicola ganghwensis TaxID=2569540 RepID=UPI001E595F06|nr:hypothetical protein [Desulfosediminicola ganghwensis]